MVLIKGGGGGGIPVQAHIVKPLEDSFNLWSS